MFLAIFYGQLSASSSITHAYLAKVWIEQFEQKFLLGSLFPDIRYIADIPREKTHERGITIDDIKNAETSFLAGCKLHSFIDGNRWRFVQDSGIYSWLEKKCQKDPLLSLAFPTHKYILLCMLEDEVIKTEFQAEFPYKELTTHFDEVYEEELIEGVTVEHVQDWHNFLKAYFDDDSTELDEIHHTLAPMFFARGLIKDLAKEETIIQYTKDVNDPPLKWEA